MFMGCRQVMGGRSWFQEITRLGHKDFAETANLEYFSPEKHGKIVSTSIT